MSLSRRAFTTGLAVTPLVKATPTAQQGPQTAPETPGSRERLVFDEHEMATVAALAEVIIPQTDTPGAREARVHEHLDRILGASPEAARTKFLDGLWWLDGYCLRTSGKPFAEFSPEEQQRTVRDLYSSGDPEQAPGKNFVQLAKDWTAKIYYSTEAGQKELNKGGRVPASYVSACSG